MRARAQDDHEPPQRPALQVEPGDVLEISDRASEWPAFVFVTCAAGSGWVPQRYLDRSSGRVTATTAYDTAELSISRGDLVTVMERDDTSGWWWCRNDAGDEGWVPTRVLTTDE